MRNLQYYFVLQLANTKLCLNAKISRVIEHDFEFFAKLLSIT